MPARTDIRRARAKALNGVAPRGGFAWSLSNRDVIRGGYGFYWAPMQFSGVGETAMGRLGYTATTTYLASTDGNRTPANSLSNPFPAGILTPQGSSKGLATGAGGVIDFVDQSSQPGQVQQYSVDYTRELPGSIAVSIGYSGSRSEQMPVGGTVDTTVNINQIDPQLPLARVGVARSGAESVFRQRGIRQPRQLRNHRARPAASAVPAVHRRACASRHRSANALQRDDAALRQADSEQLGRERELHVQPADGQPVRRVEYLFEPQYDRARQLRPRSASGATRCSTCRIA